MFRRSAQDVLKAEKREGFVSAGCRCGEQPDLDDLGLDTYD
jgi:hypothetical protein